MLSRSLVGTALMLVLALALPIATAAAATSVSEHKLKAAFLYNFTKFVEWPAARFQNSTDPIVIGLIADEGMQAELASIIANRQVNGRALIVRPVTTPADVPGVHIIFVSTEQASRLPSFQQSAEVAAVLTVGDAESCRTSGGSICFTQQGEKLRFEINMDSAERAHLKISSQLQKLAVAVHKAQ